MRKTLRTIGIVASFGIGSLILTACDPPYPPEFLAQIAEQTYTCEAGNVSVYSDPAIEPATSSLVDALSGACVDPLPVMSISAVATEDSADLVVSAVAPKNQGYFLKVPFGFDAAVVVYNVPGADSISVSYSTAAKILSGQITNWNDPAIVKENPDFEMPDLAISIAEQSDALAVSSIEDLLSAKGHSAKFTGNSVAHDQFVEADLAEGQIAIVTNSAAVLAGASRMNFLPGGKDENGDRRVAAPTEDSLTSGGTQLAITKQGSQISMKIDTKLQAKSAFEGEAVATPYQALIPVYLYAFGEDTLLKRAVAAFMLRLDSQGSLGYANFSQLPEKVRIESLALARKGLPVPKVKK